MAEPWSSWHVQGAMVRGPCCAVQMEAHSWLRPHRRLAAEPSPRGAWVGIWRVLDAHGRTWVSWPRSSGAVVLAVPWAVYACAPEGRGEGQCRARAWAWALEAGISRLQHLHLPRAWLFYLLVEKQEGEPSGWGYTPAACDGCQDSLQPAAPHCRGNPFRPGVRAPAGALVTGQKQRWKGNLRARGKHATDLELVATPPWPLVCSVC